MATSNLPRPSHNEDDDQDDASDCFFDAPTGYVEARENAVDRLERWAEAAIMTCSSPGHDPLLSQSHLPSRPCEPVWRPRAAITTTTVAANTTTIRTNSINRPKTADGVTRRSSKRYSLPLADAPAIPPIPARFLHTGRPASVVSPSPTSGLDLLQRQERGRPRLAGDTVIPDLVAPQPRRILRSLSVGRHFLANSNARPELSPNRPLESPNGNAVVSPRPPPSPARRDRRKTLSAPPRHTHAPTLALLEAPRSFSRTPEMASHRRSRDEDLFLELAQDSTRDEYNGNRPPSRSERPSSRLSQAWTRRSLPPNAGLAPSAERRPASSGQPFARTSPRQDILSNDLQRHVDRYRSQPNRATDVQSLSGRSERYAHLPERHLASPSHITNRHSSPALPQYGRRRPSFGATPPQTHQNQARISINAHDSMDDSPADSSDRKQSIPDSASVDSNTAASTVWDELDELKLRIKKLELTGKLPTASDAPFSGDFSETPPSATTAPTTATDSSPQHNRKQNAEAEADSASPVPVTQESAVGGHNTSDIHPLLHSALAKAKPILSSTLYRSLEATAADALQLAIMTGSAGPQGTAFSAASIINGATASDRHVRRKADTMCRNLTDLCLALCDGKSDMSHLTASPTTLNTPPLRRSPSVRYSRNSLGVGDVATRAVGRPVSRLEAHRSSILGTPSTSILGTSPIESADEGFASDQGQTISQQPQAHRQVSRTSSRLQPTRIPRHEELSGDEDPTVRPLSRTMTDIGSRREHPTGPRDSHPLGQQRSPSLRDSLITRRANASGRDGIRELSRVPSMNSDSGRSRRYLDLTTPSVQEVEEEGAGAHYPPFLQSKQRQRSFGAVGAQYTSRRLTDVPSRATSLSQRRHVVVE